YDLATGLGSVNASNLVHNWIQPTLSSSTTLSLNSGKAVSITHGQSIPFDITVTPSAAAGLVSLEGTPTGSGFTSMASFTLQNGSATGTTASLAGGTSYSVKAHYAGNGTFTPSDSNTVTVTVAPEPSKTLITIPVYDQSTGMETTNAPSSVMYGSLVGVRVDVGDATAKATFPPLSVCVVFTCTTGIVTVTDAVNGGASSVLGRAGDFTLNSEGFSENDGYQLSGGTHQIAANYPGDHSYNPSSGSYTLTVAPIAVQLSSSFPSSDLNIAGSPVTFDCLLNSGLFTGAAPTGSLTFYDGTTLIPGTVQVTAMAGTPHVTPAELLASLTATFTTSGTHPITANYSGDLNYAAATLPVGNVLVRYPTTGTLSASSTTINLGDAITLTATATTTFKSPPMTGTFTFSGNPPFTGSVMPTLSTNANDNQVLTATATTRPQPGDFVLLTYSGDDNYGGASAGISINVIVPDFTVAVGTPNLTISAGQTGSSLLTVTPLSDVPSTVSLTCNLYVIAGGSCSFNPASQLILASGASASTTIVISTLPPSSTTTTAVVATRRPRTKPLRPSGWLILVVAYAGTVLFLCHSGRGQFRRFAASLGMAGLLCLTFSCGSGSTTNLGGGGNGGGGGGPVATTVTLTTAATKVPSGASVNLTAMVNSSKTATGLVTFYDGGANVASSSVTNGVATASISGLSVGTHSISAQYSGDSNNQPSQTNGMIRQVITGTAQASIQGTTTNLTHTVLLNVTIQ
ncbi:MAG: Ig-like domain-containing protein, partial [Steroidobacteraceae bacterium]